VCVCACAFAHVRCVCVRSRTRESERDVLLVDIMLLLSQVFTCTFFNLLNQKQPCFFNITFSA